MKFAGPIRAAWCSYVQIRAQLKQQTQFLVLTHKSLSIGLPQDIVALGLR